MTAERARRLLFRGGRLFDGTPTLGEADLAVEGRRADLVVVDGDPFAFDDLAERIVAVYQAGELVSGGLAGAGAHVGDGRARAGEGKPRAGEREAQASAAGGHP